MTDIISLPLIILLAFVSTSLLWAPWFADVISAFVINVLLAVAGVGFLWAPFAAALSFRSARRRGLSSPRYAVAGFAYSALFLFPWVYLHSAMRGRPISDVHVQTCYFALYSGWLVGVLGRTGLFFGVHSDLSVWEEGRTLAQIVIPTGFGVVAVGTFFWSLSRIYTPLGAENAQSGPPGNSLLEFKYVAPFACLFVYAVGIHPLVWVIEVL